jgi:hypothetical protein
VNSNGNKIDTQKLKKFVIDIEKKRFGISKSICTRDVTKYKLKK